ncbi:MAG: transglycosylase domain-containing protein [Christensenellales bacterium]|jgi:penicillin-binding protein 1A
MNAKNHSFNHRFISAVKKARVVIKRAGKFAGRGFSAGWRTLTKAWRHLLPLRKDSEYWKDRIFINGDMAIGETQEFKSVSTAVKHPEIKKIHKTKDDRTRELPFISKEHLSGEGLEHINMFQAKRHNPNFIIGILLTSIKLLLIAVFMIGAAGIGSIVGLAKAYMETTPTLNTAEIEDQSQTSFIYDCNNEVITTYIGTENRDWASIDEIPDMLQKAVIAIEDIRFEHHSGVDIKRLIGAFINNLMNSNVQGGSTITQQLIKNSLLSTERTYKRKIQEAYLALQLEQKYKKEQILEAYLNTISLGASNYGVKAAAMDYFDKNLDELTLRECAMLAGITQYPYLYNPRRCYYTANNPDIINNRTDHVLNQMYKAGFITKKEYDAALTDNVTIVKKSKVNEMYGMPYFVEYAIYDVITHLLEQRNLLVTDENRALIEQEIRTNGYHIYTTVDPQIQQAVEQSLADWDKYPKLKNSEDSVIRYENGDGTITEIMQPQAAAVVLDQHTGELKAVVGGRTTPTAKKTLNRVYQTSMPVGSSIKPIAVYAPAIDKNNSDGTVIPNLPLPINGWDSHSGYPSGGASKYGPVTLRTGLVNSLNSATAYALMNLVGLEDSYNYLIQMGINPSHINKTGSGLALGTSGITPIEMAGAYATIANSGTYLEPLSFIKVVDKDGNVILNADDIRKRCQVFKESTAWLVSDMLVNAVSSGTGRAARIDNMTIGGKTGTNQDVKGVFFSGISPYYTATLWIGHDQYKSLNGRVYASEYAAPLWRDFMSKILKDKENAPIINANPKDLGLVKVRICSVSGMVATDACGHDAGGHKPADAWFAKGTQPTDTCDQHELYYVCTESEKIATQFCPETAKALQAFLFLKNDSIYWKLPADKLAQCLPGALHKPEVSLSEMTQDLPAYHEFFCSIHTKLWFDEQQNLSNASAAANTQISVSNSVLANQSLTIPLEDRQSLSEKINELQTLLATAGVTAGAIEQRTAELQTLTDTLVSIYTPTPEPEPSV